MGILDKLRAELVDIIEWVDDSRHTLVWRFPRYHNQIKMGAQLIVRPGQLAIFVHRGEIADVFEPGQHRLSTSNLPVLSTLAGWKYGFDSPFKAEVYFVSTRQVTDLRWGTPHPVLMRDDDFGPVRIRAFGTYALRAVDPRALLTQLVGTDSSFEADEISELLRAIVANTFADLVSSSEIAVLDLASSYRELSEELRRRVVAEVGEEYGLDIPLLYIVNISLPEEVEKTLDLRTGMGVVGDLQAFQRFQMGRAIPVAAENPAGGLAGAGVGLGMGAAFAGGMLQGGGAGGPSPAPGAPQTPPPAPAAWHIAESGSAAGPFTTADLGGFAAAGRLLPETYVWRAGMGDWQPARELPELANLFAPPVPR